MQQGEGNGGSSSNTSDDSQLLQITKKKFEDIIVHVFQQAKGPNGKDSVSEVVNMAIQEAVEKNSTGRNRLYADKTGMSKEKVLHLKFLDEVPSDVLTGQAIKAKGGDEISVSLNDETGRVVDNGPESSGMVEILVLKASTDPDVCISSLREFNNRIIGDSDKKRPHFTKSQYVHLKKGVGSLRDIKLRNHRDGTNKSFCWLRGKNCGQLSWCQSERRMVRGILDTEKHYPPLLDDDLSRLNNIGKNRHTCLNEANVFTVKDFLFLLHVDPKLLEEKAQFHGQTWSNTVNHAKTCKIKDKKIYVYCLPSSESKTGVAFDVVGRVKGIIQDSHYVPVTNPSQADKALQDNLLSAFNNRKDITSFDDETSLLHQFPYPSSEIADRNDSSLGGDPCVFRSTTDVHDPTEPERIDSFCGQSDMREDLNQAEVQELLPTCQRSLHVNALESPNPNCLPDIHGNIGISDMMDAEPSNKNTKYDDVEAFSSDCVFNDAEMQHIPMSLSIDCFLTEPSNGNKKYAAVEYFSIDDLYSVAELQPVLQSPSNGDLPLCQTNSEEQFAAAHDIASPDPKVVNIPETYSEEQFAAPQNVASVDPKVVNIRKARKWPGKKLLCMSSAISNLRTMVSVKRNPRPKKMQKVHCDT